MKNNDLVKGLAWFGLGVAATVLYYETKDDSMEKVNKLRSEIGEFTTKAKKVINSDEAKNVTDSAVELKTKINDFQEVYEQTFGKDSKRR